MQWWHRNISTAGQYSLQGWKKGLVYSDFIFAHRIVAIPRIQGVLEDADVKLGDVSSVVFCVSGRLMLAALLEGQMTAQQIANQAKRRAREKIR